MHQVLDEEESIRGGDNDDSELSPPAYSKADSTTDSTASFSDYGSYKLPSFDGKFCECG